MKSKMVDPLESAGLCRTGVLDLSKNLTEVQNGGSAGVRQTEVPDWSLPE